MAKNHKMTYRQEPLPDNDTDPDDFPDLMFYTNYLRYLVEQEVNSLQFMAERMNKTSAGPPAEIRVPVPARDREGNVFDWAWSSTECPQRAKVWLEDLKAALPDWIAFRSSQFRAKHIARAHGLRYWPGVLGQSLEDGSFAMRPVREVRLLAMADQILSQAPAWNKEAPPGKIPGWDCEGHWGWSPEMILRLVKEARWKWRKVGAVLRSGVMWWPASIGSLSVDKLRAWYRGRRWADTHFAQESVEDDRLLVAWGRVSAPTRWAIAHALKGADGPWTYAKVPWVEVAEHLKQPKYRQKRALPVAHSWWARFGEAPESTRGLPRISDVKGRLLNELLVLCGLSDRGERAEGSGVAWDLVIPCVRLARLFRSRQEVERWIATCRGGEAQLSWEWGVHFAGQFSLSDVAGDLTPWAHLALKYGSEVTDVAPLWCYIQKENGGKVPTSLRQLRELSARYVYADVADTPEAVALAKACKERGKSQKGFEAYQKLLLANRRQSSSIPHVRVRGEEVGIEGDWEIETLNHSWEILMLGEWTDCCQTLDSAGEACLRHSWLAPGGGGVIVRYKERCVAQSWAWRGKQGELVFDNIEFLSGSYEEASMKLYEELAKRCAGRLGVNRVLVGAGYGDAYAGRWPKASRPALPDAYAGYRDSEEQYHLASKNDPPQSSPLSRVRAAREENLENVPLQVDPNNDPPDNETGVVCEHCEADVHESASVCHACGRDIAEWV